MHFTQTQCAPVGLTTWKVFNLGHLTCQVVCYTDIIRYMQPCYNLSWGTIMLILTVIIARNDIFLILQLGLLLSKIQTFFLKNSCTDYPSCGCNRFMFFILPTRARNAQCTDQWWYVLASGIDMKSAQPQSRKIENEGVGGQWIINALLCPLYGLCVILMACLNISSFMLQHAL